MFSILFPVFFEGIYCHLWQSYKLFLKQPNISEKKERNGLKIEPVKAFGIAGETPTSLPFV